MRSSFGVPILASLACVLGCGVPPETQEAAAPSNALPGAARVLDLTTFWNETSPRLSGRIVRVGRGETFTTLMQAFPTLKPGDRVLVGEGSYGLSDPTTPLRLSLSDISFEGRGPDKTTLFLRIRSFHGESRRLRFQGFKIDCQNGPCADLRGGSMHFRNCYIFNYNSGAGGSSAIDGGDNVTLVDDCVFEGRSGRATAGFGRAFDLRGTDLLFVRKTRFVDNTGIVWASFPCAFDACVSQSRASTEDVVLFVAEGYAKESPLRASPRGHSFQTFRYTTADPEVIASMLNESQVTEREAHKLAETLDLRKSLAYWIGLLRHPDTDLRHKAARRIEALSGEQVRVGPASSEESRAIEDAVRRLDADDPVDRDRAESELMARRDIVLPRLAEVVRAGTSEQRSRAAKILADLEAKSVPLWELEHARMRRWLESNQSRLIWNEAAGRYFRNP